MKTRISTRLLNPLKSKVCNHLFHDLTVAAEAELSAFYHAVRIHKGTAAATTAADLWLRVFATAQIDRCDQHASLRKVTIAAASLLSAENAQQTAPSPLGCTVCPA
jgi:hypothetical protein